MDYERNTAPAGTGECKRIPQIQESLGLLVSTAERLEKRLFQFMPRLSAVQRQEPKKIGEKDNCEKDPSCGVALADQLNKISQQLERCMYFINENDSILEL